MQNAKLWNSSVLAVSLIGGVSFFITACSPGSGGKVTGEFAPKSAMAEKLDTCSKGKLSASLQTFEAAPVKVCRKGSDGQAVDQDVVSSFQMISKKGRIGLDHVTAFQLNYKETESAPMSAEAKMTSEAVVQQFLSSVCGPVLQSPFKRAGLATRFAFQPLRSTDRKASSKKRDAKATSTSDDAVFEGRSVSPATVAQKSGESGESESLVARETPKARDANAINSILELVYSDDQSISIKDDLSNLSSGSLKDVLSGTVAPTEQQLLFCGQLLVRTAENIGLTKGRDCATLAAETETKTEAKDEAKVEKDEASKASTGLMKSTGHTVAALPTLKLADTEVLQIMTPVCGDMTLKAEAGKKP